MRTVPWPEPGGDAELCRVMGEAMSTRLDRSRPLWEIVVVDSPTRERTALVVKMHHALVDGIAAIGVGTIIFDPTPEPLDLPPPDGRARAAAADLGRRAGAPHAPAAAASGGSS